MKEGMRSKTQVGEVDHEEEKNESSAMGWRNEWAVNLEV